MSDIATGFYDRKHEGYFKGTRADYVESLPSDPNAEILEIGCAEGNTGALALQTGKCKRYVGVEINERVAETAAKQISDVIVGNIENICLPFGPATFDALILSEVLEHLIDPWETMERLAPLVKPGGVVLASSPNVSHYRVIFNLLRGRWDLTDVGVMDRTHLRWFTPSLFASLFEQVGFEVLEIRPVTPASPRVRIINRITAKRLQHLFMTQISLKGVKKSASV